MSVFKKKGGRWCSAPNCRNNSNTNKGISFFTFPKNEQRARKWAVNCRRADLLKKDAIYLNKNCTICSAHFEEKMFLNFLKNRLKPDAVPTLFNIPNPPEQALQKGRVSTERQNDACQMSKIDVQIPKSTELPHIIKCEPPWPSDESSNYESCIQTSPHDVMDIKVELKHTTDDPVVKEEFMEEITTEVPSSMEVTHFIKCEPSWPSDESSD